VESQTGTIPSTEEEPETVDDKGQSKYLGRTAKANGGYLHAEALSIDASEHSEGEGPSVEPSREGNSSLLRIHLPRHHHMSITNLPAPHADLLVSEHKPPLGGEGGGVPRGAGSETVME
jgi:hypothetical protein